MKIAIAGEVVNEQTLLESSITYELLELMFALPYLKIELLVNKEIAHRQTASGL